MENTARNQQRRSSRRKGWPPLAPSVVHHETGKLSADQRFARTQEDADCSRGGLTLARVHFASQSGKDADLAGGTNNLRAAAPLCPHLPHHLHHRHITNHPFPQRRKLVRRNSVSKTQKSHTHRQTHPDTRVGEGRGRCFFACQGGHSCHTGHRRRPHLLSTHSLLPLIQHSTCSHSLEHSHAKLLP